jgi:heme exporter protein CcmD
MMQQTSFIIAAYAVFFTVLLADAVAMLLARRRVLRNLRGRALREQRRSAA